MGTKYNQSNQTVKGVQVNTTTIQTDSGNGDNISTSKTINVAQSSSGTGSANINASGDVSVNYGGSEQPNPKRSKADIIEDMLKISDINHAILGEISKEGREGILRALMFEFANGAEKLNELLLELVKLNN